MIQTIICSEVLALLVNLIVLYGNLFEVRQPTRKHRLFSLCVLAMTVGQGADLVSWIFEGQGQHLPLLTISTLISFVAVFPASAMLFYYLYEHIAARQKTSRTMFEFLAIASIVFLVIVMIDSLCGGMFVIQNGVYDIGPHYAIYLAMETSVYFAVTWIVIRYRKALRLHDSIAVLSYTLFPALAMVPNVLAPEYSFSYPACTLSLLLIYVMLQGEQERDYLRRERVITDESRRDELTGLLNRRAFTEMCGCQQGDENIGVVFCDANGLKYANDHFGHERGDRLLCDLAEMLHRHFHHGSTFRISGDEFVVLLPGVEQDAFDQQTKELIAQMNACPVPLAAIGTAYGSKSQLMRLISLAEENMYRDKQAFYVRFPNYKRQ